MLPLPTRKNQMKGQLRNRYENEFFHLLFSQYINLNQRKPVTKMDDLLALVRKTDSFESLRSELERVPVLNEADQDFLASLQERLDAVEKLRNCVSHNRTPPDRVAQNYRKVKEDFGERLEQFLETFEAGA
jgi:hypothetical protein